MNYHMAIDMWSLGCILAELYTGFPIFPGENEQEQLSCIMEVLGVPERDLINRSSRKKLFFGESGLHCVCCTGLYFFRFQRRASASRQLQGSKEKARDQEPRSGPPMRGRALYRLYRQMPRLGSRAATKARSSYETSFPQWWTQAQATRLGCRRYAESPFLLVFRQQPSVQDSNDPRHATQVPHQRTNPFGSSCQQLTRPNNHRRSIYPHWFD